jgi:hypothetical protein
MVKLKSIIRRVLDVISPVFVVCWFLVLGVRPRNAESLNIFGHSIQGTTIMPYLVLTVPLVVLAFFRSLFMIYRLRPFLFIRLNQVIKDSHVLFYIVLVVLSVLYMSYQYH